jgi:hypothetical protein
MVDVVFASMCDGVVGVICNVRREGLIIKNEGGGRLIMPYVEGGLIEKGRGAIQ